MLIRSVACIRLETSPNIFMGCGRGWTQEITKSLICPDCGRNLFTTGMFRIIDLKRDP